MSNRIFIVEDNYSLRTTMVEVLSDEEFEVDSAGTAEDAFPILVHKNFDILLTDLQLPKKSGLDLLRDLRAENIQIPAILLTAYGTIGSAVEAGRLGIEDYVQKPFDPGSLIARIRAVLAAHEQKTEREQSTDQILATKSSAMSEVLRHARKVASLPSSVLIRGESGTGKELLARLIHQLSPRREKHFLALNCGAFPEELLESELFGYEAGAFTGATNRRAGLLEDACGGTVFLDEIGNMPVSLQMKLLRTLQESEIRRVGGTRHIAIDVRIIAATNCDLEAEIREGRFREDLFYRLSVVELKIPPLRERKEDIPALTQTFIERFSKEFDRYGTTITPSALHTLQHHDWPGNVRELENAIQRAVIFSKGALTPQCFDLRTPLIPPTDERSLHDVTAEASKRAEVKALLDVLARTRGNKLQAARILGVSYKTLLNKVREYELVLPI